MKIDDYLIQIESYYWISENDKDLCKSTSIVFLFTM
jgi:hypothetical protein